jgi:predicted Rossmann fold flavoprotein
MQTAASILIVEKSPKLLAKVRVSGGGRCNVTHSCFEAAVLARHYPRGHRPLKEIFKNYQARDVVDWFQSKNVRLKTEADGRMFPTSDNSETIIRCFMNEALKHQVKIETGDGLVKAEKLEDRFEVTTYAGKTYACRNLLVATGGSPALTNYEWISVLGHTIIQPVPSLFTFNDAEKRMKDLMGVAVPGAEVKIAGTKHVNEGALLITHWGLSGPAVIRLSAWAAEDLHRMNYEFTALVSWIGSASEEEIRAYLLDYKMKNGKQKVISNPLYSLPQRLWTRLCEMADISNEKIWAELPQKNVNRLMEFLIRCPFHIKGKTTFKEEFVTCGGVDLNEVDLSTMQSKKVRGLFFAGEVLNIDGETGGFNFQAAWSTAFLAAKNLGPSHR